MVHLPRVTLEDQHTEFLHFSMAQTSCTSLVADIQLSQILAILWVGFQ